MSQGLLHDNDIDDTGKFRDAMRRRRHNKKLIRNVLWWSMLGIAIILMILVLTAYIIDR